MKKTHENVASGGMDVHYKFRDVTLRSMDGQVVVRERLDHGDQAKLKERLRR